MTFAALADSAGLLNAVSDQLGGLTREDIKFMVKQQGGDGSLDGWIQFIEGQKDIDGVSALPWKSTTEQQNTINYSNYHRLGLDYVPYDNYPALLHEGETVLEQDTANQLRHMISKYENSEQQSANFREAIQEQTRALVERLDSILNIMSTENTNRIIANEMNRIQSPTDGNILNMVPIYNR